MVGGGLVDAKNSIDHSLSFLCSRYGKDNSQDSDYLNCPMPREQHHFFVEELVKQNRSPSNPLRWNAGPYHSKNSGKQKRKVALTDLSIIEMRKFTEIFQ